MGATIDLIGKRFGRLYIAKRVSNNKWEQTRWLCLCNCGTICVKAGRDLRQGRTTSCGCFQRESAHNNIIRYLSSIEYTPFQLHGEAGTKLYRVWDAMRQRCYNTNDLSYKNYGGRGIRVCISWLLHYEPFRDWAKNSGYSDTLTIDRVNNDGDYKPSNCQWVTRTQQANNKRNTLFFIDPKTNKKITCEEASKKYNINRLTLSSRKSYGWSDEEILTTPVRRWPGPINLRPNK